MYSKDYFLISLCKSSYFDTRSCFYWLLNFYEPYNFFGLSKYIFSLCPLLYSTSSFLSSFFIGLVIEHSEPFYQIDSRQWFWQCPENKFNSCPCTSYQQLFKHPSWKMAEDRTKRSFIMKTYITFTINKRRYTQIVVLCNFLPLWIILLSNLQKLNRVMLLLYLY